MNLKLNINTPEATIKTSVSTPKIAIVDLYNTQNIHNNSSKFIFMFVHWINRSRWQQQRNDTQRQREKKNIKNKWREEEETAHRKLSQKETLERAKHTISCINQMI